MRTGTRKRRLPRTLRSAARAAWLSSCLAGVTCAFDIEAHRGGRALWPENTLPAFAQALQLGVDTLELDLGVTRDGVVIVSHERGLDPDLARDRSGDYVRAPGTVFANLSLAQVRRYDVGQIRPGSDYARRFPEQRPVAGARIPTLAEVFALVRRSGNRNVRLNIETKIDPRYPEDTLPPDRFVAAVLAVLRQERMSDRVMIQSFDWRTLQRVQQLAPGLPTVYLSQQSGEDATVFPDRASPWTAGFDPLRFGGSLPRAVHAAGGAIWSPHAGDVDAASIAEAHQLGLEVVVWTVNEPEQMRQLIAAGVDGIISDRPDLLRQVAAQQGLPLPAATPVTP